MTCEAELMVVSDVSEALALATWPVRLAPGTPEWLGPIVSIVPGQLHALHLTLRPGPRSRAAPQPREGHAHDLGRARVAA